MRVLISRASDRESSPCEGAEQVSDLTYCSYVGWSSLEEAAIRCPGIFKGGTFGHHVTTLGDGESAVRYYQKATIPQWVIEISSIEDFVAKHGDIVVRQSDYLEYPLEVVIYDDYIE